MEQRYKINTMKVLVVEDEQRIAQYIQQGLELSAHVVDVAYDGEVGLDMALSEEYDIIVLDRMLPKIDGVTVCTTLRSEGKMTPVLMLTAKTTVPDKVFGLNSGADDYLAKPFEFSELLARIAALGRRPHQVIHTKLTYESMTLDSTTFNVTRSGKNIELSKKEFALLEFFMRHVGMVVSKDQLAQQVWNFDSDVLPNTAQVYVGYLRNKIDRPFPDEPELLKTVHGFGYMFGETT